MIVAYQDIYLTNKQTNNVITGIRKLENLRITEDFEVFSIVVGVQFLV